MCRFVLILACVFSAFYNAGAFAAKINTVSGIRVWSDPEKTRVVFDIDSHINHKIFPLKNPDRLVIDLKNTNLKSGILSLANKKKGFLKGVRGAKKKNDYRVVLDLSSSIKVKSFFVKPNKKYGDRLVIDLFDLKSISKAPIKTVKNNGLKKKLFIVAIDPGHGGEDPGALGPNKVYEKTVVLQVAKKLVAEVNRMPGMKAYLTRKGDYYVSLRKRMKIARGYQADLFVSLHADAFKDKRVKGASVYTLSDRGATSEAAKWLAKKENSSDLVGGVSLDGKDDVLASVLLDLSQTATLDASTKFAKIIFSQLNKVVSLHNKRVEQAGFVVLKSPDIPSILIELGYISNPTEEKKLSSVKHQAKLAKAILKGISGYYKNSGDARLHVLKANDNRYIVARGDTLSVIAKKYGITLKQLRESNGIRGNSIKVGESLYIPVGG